MSQHTCRSGVTQGPPRFPRFGAWLRRWREASLVSIAELSRRTGIDKGNLSRTEKGIFSPRCRARIENICRPLGMTDEQISFGVTIAFEEMSDFMREMFFSREESLQDRGGV